MTFPLPAALALAVLATGAHAQQSPPASSVLLATCAECGVVRSIKRVEAKPPITAQERKSTDGLVASAPLGGGGKTVVGSSTDVRREQNPPGVRYEVVVRLDDGRFQVVVQDDVGSISEGDKVKVERGKVVLRTP